jgi:UDP-N-acetylglucosamine:LPS N-acetylglucosamine transferase
MIKKKKKKKIITICYSDAGNGPLSASKSVENTLRILDPDSSIIEVSLIDVLKQTSGAGYMMVRLYNYLLKKNLFWNTLALRMFYKSDLIKSGSLLKYSTKHLTAIFERKMPSVVVFTNPWIIGFTLSAIKKLPISRRPKTVSLVIDIGLKHLPPAWYQKDIDLFIVATQEAREQLVSSGADEHKILVLGMPLHPDLLSVQEMFDKDPKGKDYYRCVECKDIPHVLVMGGRAGTRNTLTIVQGLIKLGDVLPLHLTVLCGQNMELRHKMMMLMTKAYASVSSIEEKHAIVDKSLPSSKDSVQPKRVHLMIEGFVPDVLPYMKAADLLITKPGALTVSEAAVLNLPMVLDVDPTIMGQEIGNVEYVRAKGIGMIASKVSDIPKLVQRFFIDKQFKDDILKNMRSARELDGTMAIAEAILEDCEGWKKRKTGSSEITSSTMQKYSEFLVSSGEDDIR